MILCCQAMTIYGKVKENRKMFISKRQYEELLQRLESSLEGIGQDIGRFQTAVQKHDMAIEDLLEEWEEKESEKDSIRKRMMEYEQSENLLLDLFVCYQEQMWNMKRFAGRKDETWAAQIALMEQKLEHCRQMCGISIIEKCGVEVDYDLHEVIEVKTTAEPNKDRLIAEIIDWGYLYKGKVKKRAQVTVYHTENTDAPN